jgi:hypothetical protein
MSSKPPNRWLDAATTSKIAEFFLQRGGKWTAFFLVTAALSNVVYAIIVRDLKGVFTGLFYLSLAMAYGSLFWTSKRTNDMVATGLGEIKYDSPNLRNESADPAINRVIEKKEAGIDPTGTSAGGVS